MVTMKSAMRIQTITESMSRMGMMIRWAAMAISRGCIERQLLCLAGLSMMENGRMS